MKKILSFATLLLVAVFTSMAFVSCGDDDDNSTSKKTSQYVNYTFNPTDDFKALFDFTVTYTDANGNEQTEAITTFPYTKYFTVTKFPASGKFVINVTPKAEYEAKDKYTIGWSTLLKTDGRNGTGGVNGLSMTHDRAVEYFNKITISSSWEFNADGTNKVDTEDSED